MIFYVDYPSTSCVVDIFLPVYNDIRSLWVSNLILILTTNENPKPNYLIHFADWIMC